MGVNSVAKVSDVGVVILNYVDFESSIRCLKSVYQCRPQPGRIVVVDNHSPNESLQRLRDEAIDSDITDVVSSGRNGGYSAGLNFGIRELQKFGCRKFVLATSDTEIETEDLLLQFSRSATSNVGVVGPRIIQPDGQEQNPSYEEATIRYFLSLLWFVLGRPGQRFWKRIRNFRLFQKSTEISVAKMQNKLVDGVSSRKVYKLHGSFQMLTEEYISRVGYLDEEIFMFGEEDLIAWNCELHGLSRVLNDSSCISHQNDSSIESVHEERASKFVVEQEEKSAQVLRRKINMMKLFFVCASRSSSR